MRHSSQPNQSSGTPPCAAVIPARWVAVATLAAGVLLEWRFGDELAASARH